MYETHTLIFSYFAYSYYEYKCSHDKSILYIELTLRPPVEKVKEHLKVKVAVSNHISNCNICKNEIITVNNFEIYIDLRYIKN